MHPDDSKVRVYFFDSSDSAIFFRRAFNLLMNSQEVFCPFYNLKFALKRLAEMISFGCLINWTGRCE